MDEVYIKVKDLNTWVSKYFKNEDIISIGDLIGVIEELDSEVQSLEEELEDLKQDVEDNYRHIPVAEQVGISDRDFI